MKIIKTLVILCLFAFIISAKLRKEEKKEEKKEEEKEKSDYCCAFKYKDAKSGYRVMANGNTGDNCPGKSFVVTKDHQCNHEGARKAVPSVFS